MGALGGEVADGDEGEDHDEDGRGLNDTEGGEVVGEALPGLAVGIGGATARAALEDGGHADASAGEDAEDEHGEPGAGDGNSGRRSW